MFNKQEFVRRRNQVFQAMEPNSIAILPAASPIIRNGDVHFPYRQQSDFYYLTGYPEASAVALFLNEPGHQQFILFNLPKDPTHEIWTGPRIGQEDAGTIYGTTQAFVIDQLDKMMPDLLAGRKQIYYDLGIFPEFDSRMLAWLNAVRAKVRTGIQSPRAFISLTEIVHEMRLFKSEYEVEQMRRAALASVQAHKRAMRVCRPGMNECQMEGELLYEFYNHGSHYPAYPSIVASGKNACVLHYDRNEAPLVDGEMILIDAGAEYNNYSSDITRTFPINGRFSPEQRAIYQLVLLAQKVGINEVRPGNPWNKIQEAMVRVITEGLVELGILNGKVEQLIQDKAYQTFYMHNSGHWLGLDTHDVGSYKLNGEWRPLAPGMALTVEPGIYISASPHVKAQWHNIGVRIEDDIVVTENGCEVLSQDLPKEIAEIEAWMSQ